jgi:hypothetical protein
MKFDNNLLFNLAIKGTLINNNKSNKINEKRHIRYEAKVLQKQQWSIMDEAFEIIIYPIN